jgi:maltokinase-like protein
MAVIHNTTLTPSKMELLAAWLPAQPWYLGTERLAHPVKAGGFRLDDPEGEVGIEFMVVNDGSGDHVHTYLVPLSYRGAPLDRADDALIGTTQHGVLGKRWIYDGVHDPVLAGQLLALIQGAAEPQAQGTSGTADRTVTSHFTGTGKSASIGSVAVINGPCGTDLIVQQATSAQPDGASTPGLTMRVARVLEPMGEPPSSLGYVTAIWRSPEGIEARGLFAELLRPDGMECA